MNSTLKEFFDSVREGLGKSSAYICPFEQVVINGKEWHGEFRVGATEMGMMANIALVRPGHKLNLAISGKTPLLAVNNLEEQINEWVSSGKAKAKP